MASPINFSEGEKISGISRPRIEAPSLGKVLVDVEASPRFSLAASIWGMAFLSLPYLLLVKEVKSITGQRQCSSLALNLVLLSVANMYPLFHRRAARKPRSSPRPAFDPLEVDPLAMVVLDEGDVLLELEDGEFVHELMEQEF
ncbi:hypothetical protein AMTR_s00103p00149700 [Amborella trichopoda]|uniref:Uncharacterized protein n=1 Tax=Amborella trichopoda TaxID=13333 RepID=W1P008_AMBTC|nr:hypothetical protein AMTR_s00103p00149700 [Amborella trichopoda]